jgi:hypothetical protein
MNDLTIGLIVSLLVAVAAIIGIAAKLYAVVQKSESALPASATEQQRIIAAIEAIVGYLQSNPQMDQQILQDIVALITIIGEIENINVQPYLSALNALMPKQPTAT